MCADASGAPNRSIQVQRFVGSPRSRALLRAANGTAFCMRQVPEGAEGFPRAKPLAKVPSFLLLVAGAIAIGFAPIFVRLAATGPIATAFWRMALAVPILWIISRHQNTLHKDTWHSPWTWLAGIAFALDLAAWHFAIRLTSVTNATLLANCAVLLVPPLSRLFLRRAVRLSTIGYGALAFLGIALLSRASLRVGGEQLLGDALALITATFYAAYLVAVAAARERIRASALALASSVLSSLALSYFRSAWWGETASAGRHGLDLAHRVGRDFAGLWANSHRAHPGSYPARAGGDWTADPTGVDGPVCLGVVS